MTVCIIPHCLLLCTYTLVKATCMYIGMAYVHQHLSCALYIVQFQFTGHLQDLLENVLYDWLFPHPLATCACTCMYCHACKSTLNHWNNVLLIH